MLSISCIENGKVNIEFIKENTQEVLLKNKIAIFNPYQVHCSKESEIKTIGYYTLYLDIKWCINLQKKLNITQDNQFMLFDRNMINNQCEYETLIEICEKIQKNTNFYNFEKEIAKFISSLFSANIPKESKQLFNKIDKSLISLAKEYMLDNLDENISLEDLSSYTGYNSTYISRIFKKEFGLSPHAFMVNEKINRSKNLLLDNTNTISYVASKSGFYDQSHFSRNFKKLFASSPNTFLIK